MSTQLTFFFAFVVVLALIGAAAWLVRRFAGNRLGANANDNIGAGDEVGEREGDRYGISRTDPGQGQRHDGQREQQSRSHLRPPYIGGTGTIVWPS